MKNLKLTFLFMLVSAFTVSAKDFIGTWEAINPQTNDSFTLTIVNTAPGEYEGIHCAVTGDGSRSDCNPEADSPTFTAIRNDGDSLNVLFSSQYSGDQGKASVMRDGDTPVWEITESPEGEHYLPTKSVLKRK